MHCGLIILLFSVFLAVSHFSHICLAFEISSCFAFQSLFPANCFVFQSVSHFRQIVSHFSQIVSHFSQFCSVFRSLFRFVFRSVFRISAGALYDFDVPSFVDCSPSFETTSNLVNLPNLSDYDIDEHMPQNIDSRYFTLPELSSFQSSSSDFSILHTNIRSLSLHHDELVYLSAHTHLNLDVIGVSEIWHSNDNPISTNVDIPGYTLFKTSSLTQNGGVGLYIRNSLTSKPRIDLDSCTTDFETVWVEIENKRDKDFLICCVYRHPSSNVDNLTSHFQNLLSKIPSNKLLFIMGDFNVNLLDYASHTPTTDFVNSFFSHSLLPSIHHPTRVSEHRASIIDNIYTNATNANLTGGNILTQITDHFPQFLILKNTQISHIKSESFKYDYSKFCAGSITFPDLYQ